MPKTVAVQALDQIQSVATDILRPLGFKRKGRCYNRQTKDDLCQVINFQMYKQGDRFCVNLGVYVPEVATILGMPTGMKWVQEYHCCIRDRIGRNGIDGTDMWWVLKRVEDLGPKIALRLEKEALPYLAQYETRELVLKTLKQDLSRPSLSASPKLVCAAILKEQGDVESAVTFLQSLLDDCSNEAQKDYVHEIATNMAISL